MWMDATIAVIHAIKSNIFSKLHLGEVPETRVEGYY
jgi:hypothetical protein